MDQFDLDRIAWTQNAAPQLDILSPSSHYRGMVRKRVTLSYDPEALGCDVIELLEQLKNTRGSQYFNRSLADIGGMVLAEALEAECNRLRELVGKTS